MPEFLTTRPLPENGLPDPTSRVLLLTLTMTSSLGIVASTIYVPSIPAIASALETSVGRVQLTFVGYLLAFAASMLVLGPLSDRYGRRRTIICGLAVSALASVACAVSPTIEFLIAARVVQGTGACAGLVVGRAITRELWGRDSHQYWADTCRDGLAGAPISR
jgi:DHA1 family bicyclomycin/chloramphenicol resistance-like MFS transporter